MQNISNKMFITFLTLIFVYLLYLLAPILTPFLVGALLAYLVNPLVHKLMRFHLPRLVCVVLVFVILFFIITLVILLLIPLIQTQVATFAEEITNVIVWVQQTIIPWVTSYFGIEETLDVETVKNTLAENWMKAGSLASWFLKTILHSGFALFEWLTTLILIPVVTFYLLRDWDSVLKGIHNLLPRKVEPTIVKLVKECDSVLSAFFRGQLLVMLALGVIYSAGLSLIGLQIGLVIGMIAGLVSIVPYLGCIVGIVAASIAAFVQFGSMTSVLLVFLVFGIGQVLESTLLTPKLVGDRIGLHPVAVIFAILAGGSLFGFFGVLLALPVAAVMMVLIRFLDERYRHSKLYQ